jgi:N-acetylmuramic acid 6-phosphate etherase
VRGNRMVDMQLTNHKLVDRGVRTLLETTSLKRTEAEQMLHEHGSVRAVLRALGQE